MLIALRASCQARFPTTTPDESIGRALAPFREHVDLGPLAAVGIASFGPIDPNPASPAYGHITTTPKPGWAHTDFAGAVGRALGVPVGFDTDVNVAALGEGRWGAAQGLGTFIYLTVGTGIGGGGMVGGRLLHGLMHPEMGHVRIPHDLAATLSRLLPIPRRLPRGLASGPAIEGAEARRRDSRRHTAWDLEAEYLALGVVNYVLTLSPERVIMGAG